MKKIAPEDYNSISYARYAVYLRSLISLLDDTAKRIEENPTDSSSEALALDTLSSLRKMARPNVARAIAHNPMSADVMKRFAELWNREAQRMPSSGNSLQTY